MNWYLTKIVFQIISGKGNHTAQFDEQLRLVQAKNKTEANIKALEIGAREEDSFMNEKNELVQWKFLNVSELYKLPALTDGTELYSRVKETKHPAEYIDLVNKKAEEIRNFNLQTEPQFAEIN